MTKDRHLSDRPERFADEGDYATWIEQTNNEALLAEARAKAAPKQVANEDGTYPFPECVECGEDIAEGRLKLGFDTCITCATEAERRRKQFQR